MDKTSLGYKLKRIREQSEYTVENVALICEVTIYQMKDIEQGVRYPSDKVLQKLLELYRITEEDLNRRDYTNHKIRKHIINYIQLGIALLLIAAYALPFAISYYGPQADIVPVASGFQMLFNDSYGYTNVISIIFILLIAQLIIHILLYTNFKRFSNIFKVIFLMIDIPVMIVFYIDFNQSVKMESTLWVFIALLSIHTVITIYDLLRYPLEHDFKSDKGQMRRWLLLAVNLFYAVAAIWIIRDIITYSQQIPLMGYVFYGIIGLYLIGYLLLDKSLFETRKNATIMTIIPPIVFLVFILIDFIGNVGEYDAGTLLISLSLFIPAFVINIDYFIDMARERITKGDTKEI